MTTANPPLPTDDPQGPQNPHAAHVAELIEAYLAGGLTTAERTAFEAHVASCGPCAELLGQVRRADLALADLFGPARPAEDFEDHVIDRLRLAAGPRRLGRWGAGSAARTLLHPLHPAVRRVAAGVAAAVVLAAVGAAASSGLRQQSLPFMRNGPTLADLRSDLLNGKMFGVVHQRAKAVAVASNLRQMALAAAMYNSSDSIVIASPETLGRRMTNEITAGTGRDPGLDGENRLGERWTESNSPAARGHRIDRVGGPAGAIHQDQTVTAGANALGAKNGNVTAGFLHDEKGLGANAPSAPAGAPAATPTAPPVVLGTSMNGGSWAFGYANSPGSAGFGGGAGGGMGGGQAAGGAQFGSVNGGNLNIAGVVRGEDVTNGAATPTANNFYSYHENAAARGPAADASWATKDSKLGVRSTAGPVIHHSESAAAPAAPAVTDGVAPQPGQPGGAPGDALDSYRLAFKPGEQFEKFKEGGGVVAGKPTMGVTDDGRAGQKAAERDVNELELKREEAKPTGPAAVTAAVTGDGSAPADPSAAPATPSTPATPATPATPTTPATPGASDGPGTSSGGPRPGESSGTTPAGQSNPQGNGQNAEPIGARPQPLQRKIIRNGELSFEVDSFDSSMMQITKIAGEEGGFVATTDSEKLANGKVKGTVIVRCPPERLDTLVLKLRALGELKNQKIAAQDITKQYTDLESQLRAAHAMEDRLLQIIKDGKGEIKDLLEAEKQLGVWREKIEGLQGEINYYNNLVSLSTLTITLVERDIKTPYATAQTERVSMGVETDDVEKARADAIKEIEQAKGRIIESELNKLEAGQFSAKITADVPPDAADPLVDRLKTVGHVTRLDRERRQTSEGGTGAPPPGVRTERKDTHVQLAINNLANVAPRTTTTLRLAAPDVEKAYNAIIAQVKSGGGRIVTSQLNRPKAEQVTGTIAFDVPSDKADVLSTAIRSGVEVMRLDVNENRDTLDRTDAKRGFALEIFSLASVAPRETTTLTVASRDVPASFNKLLDAARAAGGRVSTSQLNEQNAVNMTGSLDFDVPRENLAKVEAALRDAGLATVRNVSRSPDSESTVDSKVRFTVTLIDEINLTARQTIGQTVAARNVPEAFNKLIDAVRDAGARVLNSQLTEQDKPTVNGQLTFSVERTDLPRVESAIREAGETVGRNVTRSPDLQNTVDTKVLYQVAVRDLRALDARETVSEQVAVHDVPRRYERVLQALQGMDAQVIGSQLNEQNKNQVSATLDFTVRRDGFAPAPAGTGASGAPAAKDVREQAAVEKILGDSADVFGRNVTRSQDPNALDSKVRYSVTLIDADTQKPRSTFLTALEVSDVEGTLASLEQAATAAGGRAVDSTPAISRTEKGETVGKIVLDVPQVRAEDILREVRDKGRVTMSQHSRDDQVPEGLLSRARIEVTVGTGAILAGEGGLWDSIKSGLRTSATGLLVSLQFIIVGLCFVLPWVAALWLVWRLIRRSRRRPAPAAVTPPGPPAPPAPGTPVPATG